MSLLLDLLPQLMALLIALIQVNKLEKAYLFVFFQLIITIITDIAAVYYTGFYKSNELIYNIYIILEALLLTSAIYASISNELFKKTIKVLTGIYIIVALITFQIGSIHKLNYPVLILGFFLLAVFNLYFIIHPGTNKSLVKNPMLVMAIGQVIYFLGVTPYYVGRHVLISDYPGLADKLFYYINNSLALVRYLGILIGFSILLYNTSRKARA